MSKRKHPRRKRKKKRLPAVVSPIAAVQPLPLASPSVQQQVASLRQTLHLVNSLKRA